MRKISICMLVVLMFCVVGCEDSDNLTNNPGALDAMTLLGLSNGRTFVYLQTDTVITADPFTITISDTTRSFTITGSGDDWIVSEGSKKVINLKVGSSSIIQNGYWKTVNSQDSLIYFAVPPLLMERTISPNLNWEYYTPFYTPASTPLYYPFYFANFGFEVEKIYTGIETIITPAGEFDTYRFDLKLYTTNYGSEPVAYISEFYVKNLGLVRQDFNNGALHRSIILATYSN